MELESIGEKPKVNILPVSYPMITTYSQHAHLLSILTYYECAHPWIFSNYIQLFINKDCRPNWGDFYFPASYDTRPSDTCKWLISQKIHRNTVAGKWDSAVHFVIECINSNHYVHTMLNYFYIPVSDRYQKLHLHHDIFVYGYDINKEILYVADFFRNGVYSFKEIAFSDFELAFSTYNLTANPDYLNEMVYLYKFNGEYRYKYKFSFNAVMNSIKNYLSCKVHEYWDIYNFEDDRQNIHFGMEIYSTLKNYMRNVSKGEDRFGVRPFYLLYDHKRIMTLRLEYLYKQGYIEKFGHDNIVRFSKVENQAQNIINLVIKYDLTKKERLIDKVIKRLDDIEKEEFEILNLLFSE
jgi:hypothetical protein